MTSLDLFRTDPLTTSWLVAFGLVFALFVAIPVLRAALASALYVLAALTGRARLRNTAARLMPRVAHLLGSIVLGTATVAAPAMAAAEQPAAISSIDLDRDAGANVVAESSPPPSAVRPIADATLIDLDRAPSARPVTSTPMQSAELYVVRSGDTLWDIAAAQLDDPTNAETTAAWKAIWQANRITVGDEPGHIYPGELLDLGVLS